MQADDYSSAVFTYTDSVGYPDLNGMVRLTETGASYEIENCGEGCHVLIRVNETGLRDEEEPLLPPPIVEEGEDDLRHEDLHPEGRRENDKYRARLKGGPQVA